LLLIAGFSLVISSAQEEASMEKNNGTMAASQSADATARALEEYLAAVEEGTAPPREEFLARYPELAEDLDACLAALRFIDQAAEGPRSVVAGMDGVIPPDQSLGQLGDFRLIREVGRGGMGVVYEAEQVSLGRRVALKVLPFAATMDPRRLQRFHNEARAAASLDHPHIVHVHAVGCERAVHFYAMQFIEGQTLATLIADLGRAGGQPVGPSDQPTSPYVLGQALPADTAPKAAVSTERAPRDRAHFRRMAELGIQAAEALDYAHTLGIVHRDVKPANLLVDGRGSLWVTDFGLAHIQSDARLTMTGDLVGTLRYMSPEQALAKRVVLDHRTDVYSLGATLYELLTLEPAFTGSDRQELLRQIALEESKPPRRINREIPEELETIVLKAMEKNPADRYSTAKELAEDLRRFLADEPIQAKPAGITRRLRKWAQRHPATTAGALAALTAGILVLSGGVGWLVNDQAARAKATKAEVTKALDESVEWQRKRRVPEALAAARRAQAAMAGSYAEEELRRRTEARVFDLDLLARLEEARLESAAVKENRFDNSSAVRRYGVIFQEFHVNIEGWSALEAGKHIADLTVALELAALLDDWAMLRLYLNPKDGAGSRHLLHIARAADPDKGRTQVRDALAKEDQAALVKLVSEDKAVELLPWTVSAVAKVFIRNDAQKQVETLLRREQRRHPDDFWINEDLGGILARANPSRYDEAISFLTAAVALRPQSPGAHNNLGFALSVKKDLEGAIAEFRKAIDLDPKYAAAHNNLGSELYGKEELDEAITEFRKAIDLDPKMASAHFNLGNVLFNKKELYEAIAEFRKAIDLDPKAVEAHINLGVALLDKKELEGATSEFRKAIGLDPKHALAHYNLGTALFAKNDLDEGIAECRKAIDLDLKLAAAHNSLGTALFAKKDLDGAIAEYHKAVDIDPKFAGAHYNLGYVLFAKKDLDGAIAEFRKAIDVDPKDAVTHFNLGNVLRDKNDLEWAIAEYHKAIDIDPRFAGAHYNLGNVLRDKNDLEEAIAEYHKAIDIDPKFAGAHYNLGNALFDKKDMDRAIVEYRKAADLDPKFAPAHSNLGFALRDKKDLDGAMAEFRMAVDLDPKNAAAHSNLGIALSDKEDLDGAISEYRKAIDLNPKDAFTHYTLGNALRDKNDLDGAIAEYRQAINLDPILAEPHCNLAQVLRTQGQFAVALTNFRRGHELGSKNPLWTYPSARWIKECERLVELDAKLPAILGGKESPADAGQRTKYADVCQKKRLFSSAARLFREAIVAQPDLVASPANGLRYNAACAAALAGCGQGKDAGNLAIEEYNFLRQEALTWLRADLAAWRLLLDKDPDKTRPMIVQQMQHWQSDPDFKGVRGPDALAKLPEAERKDWQKLWADVADMLAKAEERNVSPAAK
jgi:tetratricopeptide (TPR) repeat protein